MASPNDNFQLRDGTDALFEVRSKDTSTAQDGSLHSMRHLATPYPVDYGTGGCFQMVSVSGTIGAGLSANSPIYSFRWTSSTLLALVRRVKLTAWSLGTGFTAGIGAFEMYRATSWTVADSGGATETLTSPAGKLRTTVAGSLVAEIRRSSTGTLTAGTRTKDTLSMGRVTAGVSTATNTPFVPDTHAPLFEKIGAEHPLTLAQNQGFVIQATVPATGTWSFSIKTEWDEVPLVNY